MDRLGIFPTGKFPGIFEYCGFLLKNKIGTFRTRSSVAQLLSLRDRVTLNRGPKSTYFVF